MRAGHILKLIHEATPLSSLYDFQPEMLHRRLSNGSLLPQIVVFQGTVVRYSYMGGGLQWLAGLVAYWMESTS